jgi:hypothetical protein
MPTISRSRSANCLRECFAPNRKCKTSLRGSVANLPVIGGITLLPVVVLVAYEPPQADTKTKCIPMQGIQICYPDTWTLSESKGRISIESPTAQQQSFLSGQIVVTYVMSQSTEATQNEIIDQFFDGFLELLNGVRRSGGTYYTFLPTGKRHYGKMTVLSGTKGLPEARVNSKGELSFGYWRSMEKVLFPVDNGFVKISCSVYSEDAEGVPDDQTFGTLVRTCTRLIEDADKN